ncbi:MAG: hypothetical protein KDB23_08710 [Planctomycetales bacterium]|nr:hypothetical protein [Planctomycetales bacterium]
MTDDTETRRERFAQHADQQSVGLLQEFWAFLRHSPKWWLVPIVVVLMLLSLLVMLGGTAAAPFIYTLF